MAFVGLDPIGFLPDPMKQRLFGALKERFCLEKSQMDTTSLENWLWDAACTIRGPLDAPRFEDHILPLIFPKRLSDVFDDEV